MDKEKVMTIIRQFIQKWESEGEDIAFPTYSQLLSLIIALGWRVQVDDMFVDVDNQKVVAKGRLLDENGKILQQAAYTIKEREIRTNPYKGMLRGILGVKSLLMRLELDNYLYFLLKNEHFLYVPNKLRKERDRLISYLKQKYNWTEHEALNYIKELTGTVNIDELTALKILNKEKEND